MTQKEQQTNKIKDHVLKEVLGVAYFTTHSDFWFNLLSNFSLKNLFSSQNSQDLSVNKKNLVLLIIFIILILAVLYVYKDMIFPPTNINPPNPNSPF